MNAAVERPPWSCRRRGTLIALAFAAHLALIFAFGDRGPSVPRPPAAAPGWRLAAPADERVALNNPTLFALPHRHGFSGAAWQWTPTVSHPPFRWTEPPRWLALPANKLGFTLARFMQANVPAPFELETKPAPELTVPTLPDPGPSTPAAGRVRTAGGLTGRRLLSPPELPVQPWTDWLSPSVVQVLVGSDGRVMSPPTLLARSGSPVADQFALDWAKSVRFESFRPEEKEVTLGTMIFEWHTVPLTNSPAVTP